MKERPILFSGEMVRALLDGRKTQTRRVVKPAKDRNGSGCQLAPCEIAGEINNGDYCLCPYGQPGDRLWVREAFRSRRVDNLPGDVAYRADHPGEKTVPNSYGRSWKPSIHMPRWACRLLLEVTAVRVERLQDITEDDAWNEGVQDWMGKETPWKGELAPVSVHAFAALWESINGSDSWDANPWVWVVEFRVIEPGEVAA
ncbi:hypothetical protein V6R97_08640 [Chromohalobacter salexigens]|uniref:hypothetical protein n=1 Tax=Chromohalobacter israelensis TaxID=141390 RepID=UPI0032E8BFD0